MAATPLRFTIEQLRLSEASPRYAVYCSRKLADATKVDVLDDISPPAGDSRLADGPFARYAHRFLEECGVPGARTRAPQLRIAF
jgi:hypothetical protein